LLVELDRLDTQRAGPTGLVAERIVERRLGVLLTEDKSIASESPSSTRA
jgi:hypothetical protein